MNGYDCCESCGRIGSTMTLALAAAGEHAAADFQLCGYCMADHFAWVRSLTSA